MGQLTPDEVTATVRSFGLSLPDAWEDHPWGETALKVRKKVFVFLGSSEGAGLSVKLPISAAEALKDPRCTPTGYGLGRHGWVSMKLGPDDTFDEHTLIEWVAESYRAVAPKTLARQLEI